LAFWRMPKLGRFSKGHETHPWCYPLKCHKVKENIDYIKGHNFIIYWIPQHLVIPWWSSH
jgi:hypothetical protein